MNLRGLFQSRKSSSALSRLRKLVAIATTRTTVDTFGAPRVAYSVDARTLGGKTSLVRALDPALTDEKCHFWHFRFAPHGHMIMSALVAQLARNSSIKRVYVINQDYVWGHSVAKDAQEMLAARRPDIEIVGSDLHPIGKVKDFAPYIAKVKAAKADAIVTGNWGNDLALLIKAAKEAGLRADVYAPLAGLQGAPTMIGESGADRRH